MDAHLFPVCVLPQGPAFGMPGVLVDGMDVLKVREVAVEAIARARRGDGPTLIEASTYRFRGHSLADPDELRSKEEKAKWAVSVCGCVVSVDGLTNIGRLVSRETVPSFMRS